ncbi:MAG: Na+-dependent transporter [Chlorogloeopsis fritschii C42_A2020_084]|uniref:bile acid:sodium symporter family protein n=1 Tax=Chlorogloeopsis fritschii TaxID=1124 RepID=UPI0019EA5A79|nr:Na+-dependent transporter [Chlorogloeopsis fritschii]MBF2005977.1 Na+-dependent transporter [Chlorogloeopsis fritschii C42_A2020_084]
MNLTQLILLALKVSIVLAVFALGLGARLKDITYLFRHPRQLVRSLLSMYIIMPLVAGAIVAAFNLYPAVEIALIALSLSPIPPILPKKQLKAGGEEDYTFGLLVAMSLLAIVFAPLMIKLLDRAFGRTDKIPPVVVAQIVLSTVLVWLAIGITVRYLLPAFAQRIAKPISVVASVLMLVSLLPILFTARSAIASLIGNGTIIVIVVFVLIGLAAGHLLGGPNPHHRTVLALSTATRHPGVAIAITHTNFPEQKLALAAILLYLLISGVVTIPYLKSRKSTDAI